MVRFRKRALAWRAVAQCGLALVCACVATTKPAQAKTLDAVASFTVLADVVREVGGAHVKVKSLVPPNGDPHEYEPSPDDARALKAADIAFLSGMGFESWFDRLARAAGVRAAPVAVSADVRTRDMTEDGKTVADPHVWNDPNNVIVWVDAIATALVAADPDDARDIRANAARYVAKLRAADAYAHGRIDPIPAARRKVLTSHDSLGYLAKAYGIEVLSPVGYSTETEPSAAVVARLIDQIRRERIKVYFLENSGDGRLVKQIGAATGATPGGTLYVESLSPPDGPAPSYIAMFRGNIDRLAEAMMLSKP